MADVPVIVYVGLAVVAFIVLFVWKAPRAPPKGTIPMPEAKGGLPFFGHVAEMLKSVPWDLMTEWSLKYGPIYKFHLFGKDCVCVADPDLLKEIMHNQMSLFKKDTGFTYKYVIGTYCAGAV